ncbi:MAG: S53 family peptidase, partial [Firmicutes bacterium]|nr:S53 family peptidase [Bacillota bacterium]
LKWRHLEEARRYAATVGHRMSWEELVERYAPPQDIRQHIHDWLSDCGIAVVEADPAVISATGTFKNVQNAFNMAFQAQMGFGHRYYMPIADPSVPEWMAPYVESIVGMENISKLERYHRIPFEMDNLAHDGKGFYPDDIAKAYNFPVGLKGKNVTIGILEFTNGYNIHDLNAFWDRFSLPRPHVEFVSVDGEPNSGGINFWDLEATLDLEWAGAMAPGAKLVVYEASGGTSDKSFALSVLRALTRAIRDKKHHPDILSFSYGNAESRVPTATIRAWDAIIAQGALMGIPTLVASGDTGAYGLRGPGHKRPHVDAPAACPHAVAVGGTSLVLDRNKKRFSEKGWANIHNNGASGGGISQAFDVPEYQQYIALPLKKDMKPGRGVPDVALNADPETGYAVYFQGQEGVVGGTSVSAPVWAAIIALLFEQRANNGKHRMALLHNALYSLKDSEAFYQIVENHNDYGDVEGYQCAPGWNAVTGLGVPDVARLLGELS